MKVFIRIRDLDLRVMGVFREKPEDIVGHTIYNETYSGASNWAGPETEVFRDGFQEYRAVDLSEDLV